MNVVDASSACQLLTCRHALPSPEWALDRHRNADGRSGTTAPCGPGFPAEAAVRLSALRHDGTFRTTLTLAEHGRFQMTVRHLPSQLEISVDCDAMPGYDWLCSQRSQLECRLMQVFARPARVIVTLEGGRP